MVLSLCDFTVVCVFFKSTFRFSVGFILKPDKIRHSGEESAQPCNLPSFNIISFLFPQSTVLLLLLFFLLPTSRLYFIGLLSPVHVIRLSFSLFRSSFTMLRLEACRIQPCVQTSTTYHFTIPHLECESFAVKIMIVSMITTGLPSWNVHLITFQRSPHIFPFFRLFFVPFPCLRST